VLDCSRSGISFFACLFLGVIMSSISPYYIKTKEINCSICIEPLSKHPHRFVRTQCGHLFHNRCFNEWRLSTNNDDPFLERPCPNCNRPAEDAQYIQRLAKTSNYKVIPAAVPGNKIWSNVQMIIREPDQEDLSSEQAYCFGIAAIICCIACHTLKYFKIPPF
jgi:Ring finger domain